MKKMFIVITFLCFILIGCKEHVPEYRVNVKEDVEEQKDKVIISVSIEEDEFSSHVSRVQELINVFDVEEQHDTIYEKISSELSGIIGDDKKKAKLREIVTAHMDYVKDEIIANYVMDTFDTNDDMFMLRLSNHTDNKGIIDIVVEYEWFYYQREQ